MKAKTKPATHVPSLEGPLKPGKPKTELTQQQAEDFISEAFGGVGFNGRPLNPQQERALVDLYFRPVRRHYETEWPYNRIDQEEWRPVLFTINPKSGAWMWADVPAYRHVQWRTRRRAMRPIGKKDEAFIARLIKMGALPATAKNDRPKFLDVLQTVAAILIGRPIDYASGEDVKGRSAFDVNPMTITVQLVNPGAARPGQINGKSKLSDRQRANLRRLRAGGATEKELATKYGITTRAVRLIIADDRSDSRLKYVKKKVRIKRPWPEPGPEYLAELAAEAEEDADDDVEDDLTM